MDKPHGLRECIILDDDGYAWVPGMAITALGRQSKTAVTKSVVSCIASSRSESGVCLVAILPDLTVVAVDAGAEFLGQVLHAAVVADAIM